MYFEYNGHKIYYEVHGEGYPLVMLNGIMMSTKSWETFLPDLSKNNKVILLDMLNQGQSEKVDYQFYHDVQVEIVNALVEHLNIKKVNLFGISYGGEIALQFTLKYQEKINKLFLSNTCANTSYWLEEVGNAWNNASDDALSYYLTTIPFIYSPKFFVENKKWIENRKSILLNVFSDKTFINSMKILTNSSVGYDVRDKLSEIKVPTMILGSEYDFITPYYQQKEINKAIENSELIFVSDSGHAVMYEKPNIFLSSLLGFVNSGSFIYNI